MNACRAEDDYLEGMSWRASQCLYDAFPYGASTPQLSDEAEPW